MSFAHSSIYYPLPVELNLMYFEILTNKIVFLKIKPSHAQNFIIGKSQSEKAELD